MRLNDFDYNLPEKLIAQYPLVRRDKARLMIVNRKTGTITHDIFANVSKYLPPKSLIVFNDSKVIPARLLGKRETGAEVEIFLLKKLEDGYTYRVLMRPTKRLKVGEKISFGGGKIVAEILDKDNPKVRLNRKNVVTYLQKIGHIPLPPYIKRNDTASDKKYYQTVYASKPGSVASPTAGLHFTKRLLNKLKNDKHAIERITLHINYATFKPVEVMDITKHQMHYEEYSVTKKTYDSIFNAKKEGTKIVGVGTTSTRVLETIAKHKTLEGDTDLFIYPGYKFKMVDVLITNFHLPKSTLLMLVSAFATKELIAEAYNQAIKKKYRFFSYGDAMIIL